MRLLRGHGTKIGRIRTDDLRLYQGRRSTAELLSRVVEDFIIAACAVEMVGEAGSCTGAFWAQARRATLIPFSVKLVDLRGNAPLSELPSPSTVIRPFPGFSLGKTWADPARDFAPIACRSGFE